MIDVMADLLAERAVMAIPLGEMPVTPEEYTYLKDLSPREWDMCVCGAWSRVHPKTTMPLEVLGTDIQLVVQYTQKVRVPDLDKLVNWQHIEWPVKN